MLPACRLIARLYSEKMHADDRKKREAMDAARIEAMARPKTRNKTLVALDEEALEEKRRVDAETQAKAIGLAPPAAVMAAEPPKDLDGKPLYLVPLSKVIDEVFHREYNSTMVGDKLSQLRLSASTSKGHGGHPRVALFKRLSLLSDGLEPFPPLQEAACIQLLGWLHIATTDPPNLRHDPRLMLSMVDAKR